jgi:hypothetical protein
VTEQSALEPRAVARRAAALRRNAAQRAERTVMRLQDGIAAMTRAGLPITGPLIKRETGLDYKTIQRNPAAYALFCKHAAYFTQLRVTESRPRLSARNRRRKQPRSALPPKPTPRDPLLERPKKRLVDRVRALEAENADLMQAAARLALAQQEIEARNMDMCAQLVVARRNLQLIIAERRRDP